VSDVEELDDGSARDSQRTAHFDRTQSRRAAGCVPLMDKLIGQGPPDAQERSGLGHRQRDRQTVD
jgi:hypothetical protein